MSIYDNIVFDEFTLLDENKAVDFGRKVKAVAKNAVSNSNTIQKAKLNYDMSKATRNNDHSRDDEFKYRKKEIDDRIKQKEERKKFEKSKEGKALAKEKKEQMKKDREMKKKGNIIESAFFDIDMI